MHSKFSFTPRYDVNQVPKGYPVGALINVAPERKRRVAREQFGITHDKFHVCFVGRCGVGISELINALRGINSNQSGASPVGYKTTAFSIMPFPLHEGKIVLWDTPGYGIGRSPIDDRNIFDAYRLYAFDAIVLLIRVRFLDLDYCNNSNFRQ